jgi:uncharacterized Zn finger protein
MIKPSLDQIKQLCTEASFERGQRYLEEGRVKIKEASPSKVRAVVAGTSNYRVEINLEDKKGISATCTCPYDWEGYCKHIVATLLAMLEDRDMIESMVEASSEKQQSMEALLKKVEPEALRSFLRREMERLPELQARFIACFSTKSKGKSLTDYKEEVESLYELAEDHGFVPYDEEIDFKPLQELAEIYIHKGDFLEAAKIYQALFETIAEKMDEVDDSDGFYGGEFSDYLKAFLDCIAEAGLKANAKREYIEYLFDKYLQREPDYFQDDYEEALRELCTSEEDLRYWKELLETHLPGKMPDKQDGSSYYQAQELISMRLYVLSRLKEVEEFYSLMEKHYRSSDDLCLMYAQQLLKEGDREKALKVAEEGMALFPDYALKELREFLAEIYKDTDPVKYRETLQSLFLLSREWKYYERLKMASSLEEWRGLLQKILVHFTEDRSYRDRDTVIEIYLREKMYDKALSEVLAQKSFRTLSRYQNKLAHLYPAQYFNAYRELIFPFAEKEMGRRHYQEAVSYLKRMKEIKGFEGAVHEIVERLREENKRKPAFIDEMKEL